MPARRSATPNTGENQVREAKGSRTHQLPDSETHCRNEQGFLLVKNKVRPAILACLGGWVGGSRCTSSALSSAEHYLR
jgi:hypothetical protein